MWLRIMTIVAVTIGIGTIAGVASAQLAQLGNSQTASGFVSVIDTSVDLYICEPGDKRGPECGSDDNDGDEFVFENLEDIKPGDLVEWDIRLKNVGNDSLIISDVTLNIREVLDPGDNCPDDALHAVDLGFGPRALRILGKDGDTVNDNPTREDFPQFPVVDPVTAVVLYNIRIAAGDYEDVRIGISMAGSGTERCDGNIWRVFWKITALPVS